MAYVSQELKAKLAPKIKAVLKKYNVKGSIAVRHHSTLVLNVKSSAIDFIGNTNDTLRDKPGYVGRYTEATDSIDVNVYHYNTQFTGVARDFIAEVHAAMSEGNWDKSDSQSDYFNVGWYVDINIGRWDKPYQLEA